MSAIKGIHDNFTFTYTTCNAMLSDSTVLYQQQVEHEGHIYTNAMHNAIIEHCFMKIYLAWEILLEKSFISYLKNEPDLKGNTYVRYGFPEDDEHAYNMIKGTKNYPDWTNINDVKYLANIYFKDAGVYAILNSPMIEIEDIKNIRNRISHVSEKSVKAFHRLLAKTITQTSNIEVADFLMFFKDQTQTYFTYYTDIIKGYADAICNQ